MHMLLRKCRLYVLVFKVQLKRFLLFDPLRLNRLLNSAVVNPHLLLYLYHSV